MPGLGKLVQREHGAGGLGVDGEKAGEAFKRFVLRGQPVQVRLHGFRIGALGAAGDVIAFRKKREARDLGGEGRTQEVENLERTGAAVAVEAIIIADHVNGIIYTTRDGGQTFEAEKTAKQAHGAGVSTRRVLRISETER
jgi:hypothetical protein